MGEYHGRARFIRSKSLSNSKSRIFRAAFCLVRYLGGASALHPEVMCATHSRHLPHDRRTPRFNWSLRPCLVLVVELGRQL